MAEPDFTTRVKARKAKIVVSPVETAGDAIGVLEPGCRLFGFTKGQFSLLDLVRAVVNQTGPVHFTISTWTAGIRDTENVGMLKERGDFLSLRLLVDRSFVHRKSEYAADVRAVFGDDAIVCAKTHAKFAVLTNEKWNIAIRSSMNLNRNPRFEQFDLDDDADLCRFLLDHVDEMQRLTPKGLYSGLKASDEAFVEAMGGAVNEDAYGASDELDELIAAMSDQF